VKDGETSDKQATVTTTTATSSKVSAKDATKSLLPGKKSVAKVASSQLADCDDKKKKKRRKFKAKKLVLNVSQTKYQVVRYVARTIFKMRLSNATYSHEPDDIKDEWDIMWTDGTVQVDKLYRMKPY